MPDRRKIYERKKEARCPFLDDPREECYPSQMTSQKTEAMLRFCGGDFRSCDIFKKHRAELSPDPGM